MQDIDIVGVGVRIIEEIDVVTCKINWVIIMAVVRGTILKHPHVSHKS